MYVLGIESTCDETAAAIVEDGRKVISNVISTSVKEQALYGGVVPEIASRRHAEYISATVDKALADAGMSMADVDAVAVTFAPGLIGAVLVGVNFAKGLAYAAGKPLVPVHHLRGHIAANYLTHQDLKPPFLCLVASGGHSHIVLVEDWCRYKLLGRTVDDAAGEAYDKVARTLGLPYPGGPSVAAAARDGNPKAYKLPVPHVAGTNNVSFSGLNPPSSTRPTTPSRKARPGAGPTWPRAFRSASTRSWPKSCWPRRRTQTPSRSCWPAASPPMAVCASRSTTERRSSAQRSYCPS